MASGDGWGANLHTNSPTSDQTLSLPGNGNLLESGPEDVQEFMKRVGTWGKDKECKVSHILSVIFRQPLVTNLY